MLIVGWLREWVVHSVGSWGCAWLSKWVVEGADG